MRARNIDCFTFYWACFLCLLGDEADDKLATSKIAII